MDRLNLATFASVARNGSVSAAAEELHTVQSNVTKRLKELEAELGVMLFVRHSRGMTLTAAGERLQLYAEKIWALDAEAEAAVRDGATLRGRLRIGATEMTAAVRLPMVLSAFHHAHPDVQLEVRTGTSIEMLDEVLAHRLDAVLVAAPVLHPDLQTETVFREEMVLVRARNGADIATRLRRQQLTAIVFQPGCSYRQLLDRHFAEQGWQPFRRLEFDTLDGVLGCVREDVGVAILPRSAVETYRDLAALQLEPLTEPAHWVDTLFVRRREAAASPGLQRFAELLRQPD